MRTGEEREVCDLVERVFQEFVASDFSPDGVREFQSYNRPDMMAARVATDHFVLVAEGEGRIAGMLEMRNYEHVAMLFVEQRRRGLARALLNRSLEICRRKRPEVAAVTVHSSRFAVAIYERLGFLADGPERTENGITFIPMTLRLRQSA